MGGATLFEKVWAEHEVADLGDGLSLLHVDRHLMHDLNGMKSLVELRERGLGVRNPELTTATPDHGISTIPGRTDDSNPATTALLQGLREETARAGIRVYDVGQDGQGIVHVMGPELGLTQPGCLIVCGDSHTCTHGGLGALAFGVGAQRGRACAGDADHLIKAGRSRCACASTGRSPRTSRRRTSSSI